MISNLSFIINLPLCIGNNTLDGVCEHHAFGEHSPVTRISSYVINTVFFFVITLKGN